MAVMDAPQWRSYLCIGLILSSIYVLSSQAQSVPGFISIDCGSTPSNDKITTLAWEGDDKYTSTGMSGQVPFAVNSSLDNAEALQTFRYFPDHRSKDCYDLPTTTSNISFLLRVMFLHGSASKLTLPIQFDVAVNGTTLFTVSYNIDSSLEELTTPIVREGIFFSPGHLTHFCLVRDTGVPFISSLELRQLNPNGVMYSFPNSTGLFLANLRRFNCGPQVGSPTVRYPDDQFDRLWYTPGSWSSDLNSLLATGTADGSSDSNVNNVPLKVMQDAWLNNTADSVFSVEFFKFDQSFGTPVSEVYVAVYFEEIEPSASEGDRVFSIDLNGDIEVVTASRLPLMRWYANWPVSDEGTNFTFTAAAGSALGPTVSAIEVYAQFPFNDSVTAAQDVDTLATLQVSFNMTDWQGDPCFPVAWEWVSCTADAPARVDKLLLSSMGIKGSIPPTISNLDALTEIHLDNNSLSGTIPDSLASLPALTYLYVNDNDLSGEVPTDLVNKLGPNFSYYGNSLLGAQSPFSSPTSTSKKKSTNIGIIIGAIAGGAVALGIAVFILICCLCSKKKKQKSLNKEGLAIPGKQVSSTPSPAWQGKPQSPSVDGMAPQPPLVQQSPEVGRVSYEAVQIATNNLDVKIGQGSYGSVYHGWLNNREVAVKLNSIRSQQGHNEFTTEVDILTRVHHRNLVSLIGYCDEGNELILIYEFEVNGTLKEWLHDGTKTRGSLDWKKRLQIAADAAKGLEYLHKGCDPTIIHRDVKSNNILLDDSMTAKVADFGLSKSSATENSSGYYTVVKGTPGYLDPEYHHLGRLTHKSDVYSFGVVLAEIITGRPPFSMQSGSSSSSIILVDFLRKMVERNDIERLADPNIGRSFNQESMWRMADIALSCVDPIGVRRPDFTQVVSGINEAIELEKGFSVHSPLPLSGSFISRSGSNNRYQNLQ